MNGRGLLGKLLDRVLHPYSDDDVPSVPRDAVNSEHARSPIRLFIGPANEVEQGFLWARAAELLPGVTAVSMMGFDHGGYQVQADLIVEEGVYLRSPIWHDALDAYLHDRTHVIWESGLPLLGRRFDSDAFAEMERLRHAGVSVAMIFHGSDIRPPLRHAELSEWSPFRDRGLPRNVYSDRAERNLDHASELDVPVFVSTPDLLRWVPFATWCPVVVDTARWRNASAEVARDEIRHRPIVVHAPSNPRMKGTQKIEPMLRQLHASGVIEYRQIVGVPHSQMPSVYAQADVVLDQFAIGSYGVASCEALAAGKLVIGHVDDFTRGVVRERTGLDLPVLEATSDTLEFVLRTLSAEPTRLDGLRAEGPAYVETVHDGRHSASALAHFLGLSGDVNR
jgi:hypothetical protein